MKKAVLSFLFSVVLSVSVSVILVLVFSLIITFTGLKSSFITPINYVIKLISVTAGVLAFVREGKGALKGIIFGVIYFALSGLTFALVSGSFDLGVQTFLDLAYCVVVGAITGILAVNIKKS